MATLRTLEQVRALVTESFPNPSEDDIEAHVQKFSLVDCIRDGEKRQRGETRTFRTNCYYMCRRPVERNQAS